MKPIIFSTPMVQAILDGRKTQTRRIVKAVYGKCFVCGCTDNNCIQCVEKTGTACYWIDETNIICSACLNNEILLKSKYQKGDILYVRETWSEGNVEKGAHTGIRYKADNPNFNVRWRPSIFMPKEAARIFLEVPNVRCERLQSISENDAIAEGILPIDKDNNKYQDYSKLKIIPEGLPPFWSFNSLWCSIYGSDSWESNPWVWVYDFKIIDPKLK